MDIRMQLLCGHGLFVSMNISPWSTGTKIGISNRKSQVRALCSSPVRVLFANMVAQCTVVSPG